MHRVIYRSHALIGEYTRGALEILAASERRNFRDGITGFLHREADTFVQVIEGDAEAVGNLLGRLRKDPRHAGMAVLSEQIISARAFDGWDMAYASNHQLSLCRYVPEIWGSPPLSHEATDRLIHFFQGLAEQKARAA